MKPIKIERGIPIPEGKNRNNRYNFQAMKVGDSFQLPKEMTRERVASAACYYSIRNKPFKFSIRQFKGGLRLWRIA